jgi:hypothetical protein
MIKRAPGNVRYLGLFGEHILTESFTALDPFRTSVAASACFSGLQSFSNRDARSLWHDAHGQTTRHGRSRRPYCFSTRMWAGAAKRVFSEHAWMNRQA